MPRRQTQLEYLGLTLQEAEQLAESKGLRHRLVRENGLPKLVDTLMRQDRINFDTDQGKVVNAEVY